MGAGARAASAGSCVGGPRACCTRYWVGLLLCGKNADAKADHSLDGRMSGFSAPQC